MGNQLKEQQREDAHRTDHKEFFADPWLKKASKKTTVPEDARLACIYLLDLVADQFDEAVFFRRTESRDELWINIEDSHVGCVFAVPRRDEEITACLRLMERFIRAKNGFEWPVGFVAPGIVDKSAFELLLGRIENELAENARKARETETEIIWTARELGLSPKPAGIGPQFWWARCPETNHSLYINAAENSFGCGWCKRKGNVEDLRAFVMERKDRKKR